MPTPRAFAGWRSLSRSGATSDVPCRSIGTLVSIPCSTQELSSCLRTFVLDVAHFRLRPAPLIVCVVIHLREPERGFRNPYLRDLAPFARNACRRIALPSLCSLGRLVAENCFHNFRRVSRALPAMEWIPMHGCDPAYRFRVPPRHPAIAPRCRVNGRGVRNGETARAPRFPRPVLSFDQSEPSIREESDPRYVRPTTATDTADTRTHASYGYRTRRGFPRVFDASRAFTTHNALPRLDPFHPTAFSSEGEAMFSADPTTHGRVVPSSPLLTSPSPRLRRCDSLRNAPCSSSAKADSIAHS
jgi:hypothetical protein